MRFMPEQPGAVERGKREPLPTGQRTKPHTLVVPCKSPPRSGGPIGETRPPVGTAPR